MSAGWFSKGPCVLHVLEHWKDAWESAVSAGWFSKGPCVFSCVRSLEGCSGVCFQLFLLKISRTAYEADFARLEGTTYFSRGM